MNTLLYLIEWEQGDERGITEHPPMPHEQASKIATELAMKPGNRYYGLLRYIGSAGLPPVVAALVKAAVDFGTPSAHRVQERYDALFAAVAAYLAAQEPKL